MSFKLYYSGEFEKFARKIERELDHLPTLGVTKLANIIMNTKMYNTKTGRFQGPGGRFMKGGDIDVIYQTAQNVARAVLELSPEVKFVDVYPKSRRVLAFDWIDAPPPVRAKFQKTFPRVFFAHTRVPIRLKLPDMKEISRDAFSSNEFRSWLEQQIRRSLVQ